MIFLLIMLPQWTRFYFFLLTTFLSFIWLHQLSPLPSTAQAPIPVKLIEPTFGLCISWLQSQPFSCSINLSKTSDLECNESVSNFNLSAFHGALFMRCSLGGSHIPFVSLCHFCFVATLLFIWGVSLLPKHLPASFIPVRSGACGKLLWQVFAFSITQVWAETAYKLRDRRGRSPVHVCLWSLCPSVAPQFFIFSLKCSFLSTPCRVAHGNWQVCHWEVRQKGRVFQVLGSETPCASGKSKPGQVQLLGGWGAWDPKDRELTAATSTRRIETGANEVRGQGELVPANCQPCKQRVPARKAADEGREK